MCSLWEGGNGVHLKIQSYSLVYIKKIRSALRPSRHPSKKYNSILLAYTRDLCIFALSACFCMPKSKNSPGAAPLDPLQRLKFHDHTMFKECSMKSRLLDFAARCDFRQDASPNLPRCPIHAAIFCAKKTVNHGN